MTRHPRPIPAKVFVQREFAPGLRIILNRAGHRLRIVCAARNVQFRCWHCEFPTFSRYWETAGVHFGRNAFDKNRSLPLQSYVCVVRKKQRRPRETISICRTRVQTIELAALFLTRKIRIFVWAVSFACSTPDSRIFRPTFFYVGTYAKCSASVLRHEFYFKRVFPMTKTSETLNVIDRLCATHSGYLTGKHVWKMAKARSTPTSPVVRFPRNGRKSWRCCQLDKIRSSCVTRCYGRSERVYRRIVHPRHGRKTNILCAFRVPHALAFVRRRPNHLMSFTPKPCFRQWKWT